MTLRSISVLLLVWTCVAVQAAPRKVHSVYLGGFKTVSYSRVGDPAGALPDEDSLKIRPLLVDGQVKEWTSGDAHQVTDRSFVVRRVLHLNDELPGDGPQTGPKTSRWVWQRGPWLLVEKTTGHVTALKLPDYDPGVSRVAWFRDYAAYCGLTSNGKSLYAVVAQIAARRPLLAKKLSAFDSGAQTVCQPPEWQRKPFAVTFHPAGRDAATFEIVPGSAVLVEDADSDGDSAAAAKSN
jgi:hypothetical protein